MCHELAVLVPRQEQLFARAISSIPLTGYGSAICEKHAEEIACISSESDMEYEEVPAASCASTHEKDYVESVTKSNCSTADNEIREVISFSSDSNFDDYESCQQEGDGKSKSFHSFQSSTDSSITLMSDLCGSTQYGNTELNVHKWDECETEVVAKLPADIIDLSATKQFAIWSK